MSMPTFTEWLPMSFVRLRDDLPLLLLLDERAITAIDLEAGAELDVPGPRSRCRPAISTATRR